MNFGQEGLTAIQVDAELSRVLDRVMDDIERRGILVLGGCGCCSRRLKPREVPAPLLYVITQRELEKAISRN